MPAEAILLLADARRKRGNPQGRLDQPSAAPFGRDLIQGADPLNVVKAGPDSLALDRVLDFRHEGRHLGHDGQAGRRRFESGRPLHYSGGLRDLSP
jgi:hypothetical protein